MSTSRNALGRGIGALIPGARPAIQSPACSFNSLARSLSDGYDVFLMISLPVANSRLAKAFSIIFCSSAFITTGGHPFSSLVPGTSGEALWGI